jgi:hypothetical protein
MPPPPDYAEPPILWGTEAHVREMFPQARDFSFERESATIDWESPRAFGEYFFARFGPLVTARQMLGDGFEALGEELIAVFEARNQADDGSLQMPQEYLQSLVRV